MFDTHDEDPEFDEDTFRQAILYICSLPKNRRDLSKTKLHKILYYADRLAYLTLGEPITGETYIKHQFGPYSQQLAETLETLEEERAVVVHEYTDKTIDGKTRKHECPEVFTSPDLNRFSEEQQKILTSLTREILPMDTTAVSDASHNIVWNTFEMFEEIPYSSAYLDVTEKDEREEVMDWARQKAEEVKG